MLLVGVGLLLVAVLYQRTVQGEGGRLLFPTTAGAAVAAMVIGAGCVTAWIAVTYLTLAISKSERVILSSA